MNKMLAVWCLWCRPIHVLVFLIKLVYQCWFMNLRVPKLLLSQSITVLLPIHSASVPLRLLMKVIFKSCGTILTNNCGTSAMTSPTHATKTTIALSCYAKYRHSSAFKSLWITFLAFGMICTCLERAVHCLCGSIHWYVQFEYQSTWITFFELSRTSI